VPLQVTRGEPTREGLKDASGAGGVFLPADISDQVGDLLRLEADLESLSHQGTAGAGKGGEVVAKDDLLRSGGIAQSDACRQFSRQDARELAAIPSGCRVGEISVLDGTIGIEDGDEERVGGAVGESFEIRSDFIAFTTELVTG